MNVLGRPSYFKNSKPVRSIRPFEDCFRNIMKVGKDIVHTPEYQALEGKDKETIDAMLRSLK